MGDPSERGAWLVTGAILGALLTIGTSAWLGREPAGSPTPERVAAGVLEDGLEAWRRTLVHFCEAGDGRDEAVFQHLMRSWRRHPVSSYSQRNNGHPPRDLRGLLATDVYFQWR